MIRYLWIFVDNKLKFNKHENNTVAKKETIKFSFFTHQQPQLAITPI